MEFWIRAGVGDTTRYLSVHTLTITIGTQMCNVLPAAHALTGNDIVRFVLHPFADVIII